MDGEGRGDRENVPIAFVQARAFASVSPRARVYVVQTTHACVRAREVHGPECVYLTPLRSNTGLADLAAGGMVVQVASSLS